ncbi:MAG: undecaprenyl/decaprenyl-phosphate alpha-N-acetylglucosaminyl 1-phosphate transferase [Bacteroidales bacterium]|nr:undecaprenyl/decaprenyl-phosphate alpha-N-acetylglucosaminyl 1-phosphate transferase [Bacteroidales bacterium]
MLFLLGAFTVGLLITYYVIPTIVTLSKAKGLCDRPDKREMGGRKSKDKVPTIGGVAIFLGWSISSLVCLHSHFEQGMQYLLITIFMMLFIGLKDDILVLPPRAKFYIQGLAALVLVGLGGAYIKHLYGLFFAYDFSPWLSYPFSIVLILFLINAINLIDGIDGLAGGISLLVSLFLGVWFWLADDMGYAIMCFALVGSLVSFLRINIWGKENKMYMGDTGSLMLGIFLAAAGIRFTEQNVLTPVEWVKFPQAPLIALALFIVPLTDTLSVFFIRIRAGRSPFSPDNNHIHYILRRTGMTHLQSTCCLLLYTVAFIAMAWLLSWLKFDITVSFTMMMALSFAIVFTARKLEQIRERGKILKQLRKMRLLTRSKQDGSLASIPNASLTRPVFLPE